MPTLRAKRPKSVWEVLLDQRIEAVGVAVAPTVELYQERSFWPPERTRAVSLEERPPLAEADGEPLRWDAVVAAAVGDVVERRVIESYEECGKREP